MRWDVMRCDVREYCPWRRDEMFTGHLSFLTYCLSKRSGNGAPDPAHGLQPVNATADIHGKEV